MWTELTKDELHTEITAMEIMDTLKRLCKARTGKTYRNTADRRNWKLHWLEKGLHPNQIILETYYHTFGWHPCLSVGLTYFTRKYYGKTYI